MTTLFHGSQDENLIISPDGESGNGLVNFGALFFADSWAAASYYGGNAVYAAEIDMDEIWDGEGWAEDALLEQLASEGVDTGNQDLVEAFRRGVLDEAILNPEETDLISEALGCAFPDMEAGWNCQRIRLQVARRLGYHGATFSDECGSIAVLAEYLPERLERIDSDPEDD